jgi:hypothetical protein
VAGVHVQGVRGGAFKQLGPIVYVDEKAPGQEDAPWTRHSITPGDCFCAIERDGIHLYDSRNDLPVNMERFNAARRREIRAALAAANGTPPSDELIRVEEEGCRPAPKQLRRNKQMTGNDKTPDIARKELISKKTCGGVDESWLSLHDFNGRWRDNPHSFLLFDPKDAG